MRARTAARVVAIFALTSAGWLAGSAGAADSDTTPPAARTRAQAAAHRVNSKPRRKAALFQPHIVPQPAPQFLAIADPYSLKVGSRVVVTVRLLGGSGSARGAAFHLTTNPSLLRFVGSRPTGGGALLVQPSSVDGELVIYRSSVPEGFAQTESLVELEYEAISSGNATALLTEARLFDASSKELKASYESGSLVIE